MIIKFKTKKAFDVCSKFLESNGFCFRPRDVDKVIEFFYEYALLDVVGFCNGLLGLENEFEVVVCK